MTRLILVRHGESLANNLHVYSGHTDFPLTDVGIKQAMAVADYIYSHEKPVKVYASPLKRAYVTGKTISERCGIPIFTDAELKEINGGKWEGVPFDELEKKYKEEYAVWINDIGKAQPLDGENLFQLSDRIYNAVMRIAKANRDECIVLAFHATPIRVICARWMGLPMEKLRKLPWAFNASICTVELDDEMQPHNLIYNIHDYLGALVTTLPDNV